MTAAPSTYNKDNPFPAVVRENHLLSKPGSAKETRHFVVSLAGSGLRYKTGDSLGIFPTNPPAAVDEVLRLLGARGDEGVMLPHATEPIALRAALFGRLSLALPGRKMLALLASKATRGSEQTTLTQLLAAESIDALAAFLKEREFVDLLAEFPSARLTPQEFVDQLRRLVPRLYSIASSPRVHGDDVHLTVAIVRYVTNHRQRGGVCSTFLADRVEPGRTPVPSFVASSHFGVPDNDDADIIMVGPGTGVAPFRAFLQEREARGARGRNWLFFGDQHKAFDFLYEEDFAGFLRRGVLHRFDTAFSRDQPHKIYVQDRIREHGAELWRWIANGAYFFMCGDARRMARDVDDALHGVVTGHAGMDAVQATEYVKTMRREKRYQRDVY